MTTATQTPQMTDARKIQLATATSIYDAHDRAQAAMAEWGRTDHYPTGWPEFDKYLYGGFGSVNGELIVVAGETKVGKSTFVANIAIRIATAGNMIDYMTLENSVPQTYGMLAKAAGASDLREFKDLIFTPDEDLIFGDEAWNAEDLLKHMEYMAEARGVKVFVLDHLNFMFENEEQERNELGRVRVIMRKLSRFTVKYGATVFCISHMNKNTGQRTEPDISRIYGSHGIAGAATKVILMQQEEVTSSVGGYNPDTRMVSVRLAASRFTKNQHDWFKFDASETMWQEDGLKII